MVSEKFYLQQFGLQKQQPVCLHKFLRYHHERNRRLILVDSQLCIWHHLSSRLVNQLLDMLRRSLGKRHILHLGNEVYQQAQNKIVFTSDCLNKNGIKLGWENSSLLFKAKLLKITFCIDVIHEEKTSVINAVFKEFSWRNGIMTSIEWTTEIIIYSYGKNNSEHWSK